MPSVLGESGGLMMVMPRTLTFSQRTGLNRPGWGIDQGDAFDQHVAAVGETDQARARVGKRIFIDGRATRDRPVHRLCRAR